MDIETKEQLLGRFRAYLDELPDTALAGPGEENRPLPGTHHQVHQAADGQR
ncbi:MAG: hypothetical protein RKO25_01635 [Candidatus Contendobacter sp.]|nr:hypothetical protein [Candidatus Contendobacter sp.]